MQEMQEAQVRSLGPEEPLEDENGNPLLYSCWKNPMDRGAWWAIVYWIAKSQTRLSTHTHRFFKKR